MPRWFARLMLRILRMRIVDHNEEWPVKAIVAVAPHTSSRDFWYGLYSRAVIRQNVGFVGKATLFKGVMAPILKWLGGVPVDRSKRSNFTDAVAQVFEERDHFLLCLAVEGTRKKVDRFKTGFYYIAKAAEVPIVLTRFDFGNRVIEFSKPFYPTADMRADFDYFYRHFDGIKGVNPKGSFDYDPAVALEGL